MHSTIHAVCGQQKGQIINLVKRAERHFGFLKRAGRHQKGAGRRTVKQPLRIFFRNIILINLIIQNISPGALVLTRRALGNYVKLTFSNGMLLNIFDNRKLMVFFNGKSDYPT